MSESIDTVKPTHTPGPWHIDVNGWLCDSNDVEIADAEYGDSREIAKANARRIAACVNACEGIDDPTKLRTQRDELFGTLELLVSASVGHMDPYVELARSVIAKVKP